jgi:hypothetical protein
MNQNKTFLSWLSDLIRGPKPVKFGTAWRLSLAPARDKRAASAPSRRLVSNACERQEASGAVTSTVDDSTGWGNLSHHPHDYDLAEVQELYQDALSAWRKNPIAWRIISITTDYVVGDRVTITSPNRAVNKFIAEFWNHVKNQMDLRLESMCEELARSGDLFVLLFRNPEDGMSYIRFVTKDQITKIETAPNDWELELSYTEKGSTSFAEERIWLSPDHPEAINQNAIMLHYAVNKPLGALLGESDIVTMIPWLQRYSRMLEDRVRLHWAIRSFLWIVTVPTNKIREKAEQYRGAPESGSVIVKDEGEKWEAVTPMVRGADAEPDLKAVRQMIDAGSGYPPHWRGEAADANLATAQAMQAPTEKHLKRRQLYFVYLLEDILYHAYQRMAEIGKARMLRTADYAQLFHVTTTDITQEDNTRLAVAANNLSQAFTFLSKNQVSQESPTLFRTILELLFKIAGEAVPEGTVDQIMREIKSGR